MPFPQNVQDTLDKAAASKDAADQAASSKAIADNAAAKADATALSTAGQLAADRQAAVEALTTYLVVSTDLPSDAPG